jgi:hypothetical protein
MHEDPFQAVDLDDVERQIREIDPRSTEDRLAQLARIVGRNMGGVREGPSSGGALRPSDREKKNDQEPENESAKGSREWIEQALDTGAGPDSLRALAPRVSQDGSRRQSRALVLAVPILIVALGVSVVATMRTGPMANVENKTPVIKSDDVSVQEAPANAGAQPPSQPAMGASGSSAQPIGAVVVVTPVPLDAAPIPSTAPMPVAANVTPPDPPQPVTDSSTYDTPRRALMISVKPDLITTPKRETEMAPLPPTKPKTLASRESTTVRIAHGAGAASYLRPRNGTKAAH